MTYNLVEQLKNAGFPFDKKYECYIFKGERDYIAPDGTVFQRETLNSFPTLSELIWACGFPFERLEQKKDGRTPEGYRLLSGWFAIAWDADDTWTGEGDTAEIAVAKLWLNIQDPSKRAKTTIQGINFEKPVYGIHPKDTKKCTDSGHTIKIGDSCLCGQR